MEVHGGRCGPSGPASKPLTIQFYTALTARMMTSRWENAVAVSLPQPLSPPWKQSAHALLAGTDYWLNCIAVLPLALEVATIS